MAIDMDKLRGHQEKIADKKPGQSAKFWKADSATNDLRVMPPWTEVEQYRGMIAREVFQHWGVSEEQKGPVLCVDKTEDLEGNCPICQFVKELYEDKTNVEAQELAKRIKAKAAYFMNIVDLSDSTYTAKDVAEFKKNRPDATDLPFSAGDPKIQVYAAPKTVYDAILSIILKNNMDITDLENGYDIVLTKSGKGLNTKYSVTPKLKPSASDVTADRALPALDKVGFVMKEGDMLKLLAEGVGATFVSKPPTRALSHNNSSTDDLEAEMRSQLR
jgi:hypothetical protein